MIVEIDAIITKKRSIKLCRQNADGTLTIIGSATVIVRTDWVNGLETCTYKGKDYSVNGTIHISYIVTDRA